MRATKDGEFRSSVYTQRPPYADYDAPAKFQAIQSIIAKRLKEHPNAMCSYSGGSDSDIMIHHMKQRGISQESIDLMKYCGIDFEKWLAGFDTVEQSVTDTVETIRNHPLMPHDIRIGGYVIDSITGEVSTVCKAE